MYLGRFGSVSPRGTSRVPLPPQALTSIEQTDEPTQVRDRTGTASLVMGVVTIALTGGCGGLPVAGWETTMIWPLRWWTDTHRGDLAFDRCVHDTRFGVRQVEGLPMDGAYSAFGVCVVGVCGVQSEVVERWVVVHRTCRDYRCLVSGVWCLVSGWVSGLCALDGHVQWGL